MIEVTKESFQTEVLESEQTVVVDFWGPACQPCLKLMPDVEELEDNFKDQVKFVKVNSAKNRRVCINNRVMGLPAFLVFKNGEEVKRISGSDLTKQDIEQLVREHI